MKAEFTQKAGQKPGFLLYMAVGDAYGMAYEFAADLASVGPNDLQYKANPGYPAYKKAHYTDDTQMAFANMLVILEMLQRDPRRRVCTTRDFADAYVDAYRRDPRPGYSRRMAEELGKMRDGFDLLRKLDPTRSTASGAAMRAAPFGLLPVTEDVKTFAAMQAEVTHNNKTGIVSAQAVALATHAMHYGLCSKAELGNWLEGQLGSWREAMDENDPKNGLYIVAKAFDAVAANKSLSELLRYCVDYGPGQDTDTICALAMAVASRSDEYIDDLPQNLFDELENGPYGKKLLQALDRKALGHFTRERFAAPKTTAGGFKINAPSL